MNELKNRGVSDILIVSLDNLTGFTDAIAACCPEAEVQKRSVRQIRRGTRMETEKIVLNKELFTAILDFVPAGISVATDLSCKDIRHNPAAAEFLRILPWDSRSHSSADPPALKLYHEGKELAPEETPMQLAARQGLAVRDFEIELIWDDGVHKSALWKASPIKDEQGKITGAVASFKDITDQRRTDKRIQHQNKLLYGINRILQEAMTCDTEEELGRACLKVTEELTGSRLGFIGEINAEGLLDDIAISNLGGDACWIEDKAGHRERPTGVGILGISGRALQDGKPFFTNDPSSHPDNIGLPEGQPPLTAFLGVPLIHEGKTIGMIGLGNREGGYRLENLDDIEALSPSIVQVLMRKRAEEELRRLNEELEERGVQRTAELAKSNEELNALNEEMTSNSRQLEEEIIRRKESELELQAANQKAANIIESISDAFYALDQEWRFTYINAEMQRQMGIQDASEVIGKVVWDVFPNYYKPIYEMYHKVVSEQTPVRFEVHSQTSGRWNDVHAYPSPDGLSAYFLDITELKETQAKLEKSQQDVSDILNSITDPFVALDSQWQATYVNQAVASYMGKTKSELLGQNYLNVIPSTVSSGIYKNYCQAMFEKVPTHFEEKGAYRDLWFDFKVYPRQDGIIIYALDITEKKKLQQELQQSEERFRTAIENMHDSFGIYTAIRGESGQIEDFLVEYVNEAACKSNFMTREEQVGKRLLDLRPNYRGNGRFAEYCRVVETGEPHVKDALIRNVISNTIEVVDSRIVKLGDGFTAAWRDVTERKKAEEALRLSEERFSKAFHSGPTIGVIRSLEDDRIIDVNDTFLKTLEYQKDEVIGHTPLEFGYWADQEVFKRVFRELDSKGELKNVEVDLRTKSGKIIKALFYAFTTELDGEPCALVNFVDITERKRMEQKIADALEFNQEILESSTIGMVTYESSGKVVFVNDASVKITGGTKELILQQNLNINQLDTWKQTGLLAVARQVLATGISGNIQAYIKTVFEKEIWVECRFSRFISGGEPRLLMMYEDITGRKLVEERIAKLNRDLSRRADDLAKINKELESFSYSISHDLRAPLRAINGFSQMLSDKYRDKLDDEGKEYIQIICSECKRMSDLINGILQLSRLSRKEIKREELDLSAIAETIAVELRKIEPERQVGFAITPGINAHGDRVLLQSVMQNLLDNAWKFTVKHEKARIEFGVNEQEGRKVYFVRDDGAGFDVKYADKLFGAFQRLHGADEFPGNGVGLAIIKRIVNNHGGQVWAEGGVEKGATFYFTLHEQPDGND